MQDPYTASLAGEVEWTKEFVDKLWNACVGWKIGEPYVIGLPVKDAKN